MAEKKVDQLKGLLNHPQRPQQGAQAVPTVRGTGYRVGLQDDEPIELPSEVGQLSAIMQDYARRYVESRRRSGAALLDAARWLHEAREAARHGEWGVFLAATGTQEHTAIELLNLHSKAMEDARFAEAIRTNWLGASVAGLLARPSTPPEVIEQALTAEQPPKAADVRRAIKEVKHTTIPKAPGQILEIPGFDPAGTQGFIPAIEMLRETVKVLIHLERSVGEIPATSETTHAIARARQALDAIARAVEAKG